MDATPKIAVSKSKKDVSTTTTGYVLRPGLESQKGQEKVSPSLSLKRRGLE